MSPNIDSGGVLLSQGPAPQVPSALEGLTAVFGMGTGVPPPTSSPETCLLFFTTGTVLNVRTFTALSKLYSKDEQDFGRWSCVVGLLIGIRL